MYEAAEIKNRPASRGRPVRKLDQELRPRLEHGEQEEIEADYEELMQLESQQQWWHQQDQDDQWINEQIY